MDPNDVTIDSKGRLYFTDPAPDAVSQAPAKPKNATGVPAIYRVDADLRITRILAGPDTEWPNGIVISPDDKTLYVIEAHKTEGGTRAIRAYDLSSMAALSTCEFITTSTPVGAPMEWPLIRRATSTRPPVCTADGEPTKRSIPNAACM